MFREGLAGTLMALKDVPDTRYQCEVWFDYTRVAINQIQEGSLVAVSNFASNSSVRRFSVLEVTTVLPTHYALQGSTGGYPGFVVEAARSASQDWESQETTSTEDTTKIRVTCIPTNLEIEDDPRRDARVGQESNMPMVGHEVRVLDSEWTNLIANNGIDRATEENLTSIGTLIRDENVELLLRIDELLRTHFAIFGFTGVGKSNLLSTIVAKLIADSHRPVKVVFFDLMSEYTGLLVDHLADTSDRLTARILTVGRRTLPEPLYKYVNEAPDRPRLDEAVELFSRYALLPRALQRERLGVNRALRDVVSQKRLRVFADSQSMTVWDLFFTDQVPWGKARQSANSTNRKSIVTRSLNALGISNYKETTFTAATARTLADKIQNELQNQSLVMFSEDFEPKLEKLRDIATQVQEPMAAGTTLTEIVADLNDPTRSSIWVVQAHDPNDLRKFSRQLGDTVYEGRRLTGQIDPVVTFIFDEADEFIRGNGTGSYAESAEIAQTLARRGRKFGLGIGIATQRIRYLDTNIMSQPHTYFVSKLPRASDRQVVAEAFGMSEDLLVQTFKFRRGQWLVISHDATGLDSIPMSVQAPDANRRVLDWLRSRQLDI